MGSMMSERSFKDQRSEVSLERAELAEGPRRESLYGIPRGQLLEVSLGASGSEARCRGEMLAPQWPCWAQGRWGQGHRGSVHSLLCPRPAQAAHPLLESGVCSGICCWSRNAEPARGWGGGGAWVTLWPWGQHMLPQPSSVFETPWTLKYGSCVSPGLLSLLFCLASPGAQNRLPQSERSRQWPISAGPLDSLEGP